MGEEAAASAADEARIASLAEELARHSHLYYNLAQPEVSDAEFDRMWNELQRLDPDHPQLHRVGADVAPGSVKVNHLFPMQSLDKATTAEELNHFVNTTTSGAMRFLSQPKLDGSALSLEYRMGRLVRVRVLQGQPQPSLQHVRLRGPHTAQDPHDGRRVRFS
mgnify:CR=1 FL=1